MSLSLSDPTWPACCHYCFPAGQSGLLNHQSVATFTATGPATNGKSVYANCAEAVKSGWFTKAQAAKEINKASDSWMPGDCEYH